MPESSYHLKFLPSVELRGGISHLFRQKNSDQKIGNKKRFPCLRCAFYGWRLFTGRNYLFSQDKYLDLIFKIGIWNWIKNKFIALNILLYNYLVGSWMKNPVGILDWIMFTLKPPPLSNTTSPFTYPLPGLQECLNWALIFSISSTLLFSGFNLTSDQITFPFNGL